MFRIMRDLDHLAGGPLRPTVGELLMALAIFCVVLWWLS